MHGVSTSENIVVVTEEDHDVAAVGHGRQPTLTGCPWHDVNEMLQSVGLRPTRQRMALGWLLFGKGAPPSHGGNALRRSDSRQGSCFACHRLQHAQSVDRRRTAAPGQRRRHQDVFRYQRHRPSPLLSRKQSRTGRHPRSASGAAEDPNVPEGYEISRIDMVVRLRKKR